MKSVAAKWKRERGIHKYYWILVGHSLLHLLSNKNKLRKKVHYEHANIAL
jgi:hypothetical protein